MKPFAPEEIYNVSQTQFSIARYYGGCTMHGHEYFYDPIRDVLIRADVLKARVYLGKYGVERPTGRHPKPSGPAGVDPGAS